MRSPVLCLALAVLLPAVASAQSTPRTVPPPGINVPDPVRENLNEGLASLQKQIRDLQGRQHAKELPNVEIFFKAVHDALTYHEFLDEKQFEVAKKLLTTGTERATALSNGNTPWNQTPGLVVRGYRSKIDGSVQPYGLFVPPNWTPNDQKPRRLDIWLLGRGEKRTEVDFIAERMRKAPEFTPEDTLVLIPYGRFCNATKFAGEVDVFEALDDVKTHYQIDPNRIAVRGFSMGGASTWHLGAHHAGFWSVAAPGAGFAETAEYGKVFAPGKTPPPWWEQVLWRWYDATRYAANFANCPVIAYSGEIDPQKQAADLMTKTMADEGLTLTHLIGPKTQHKYEPTTRLEVIRQVDAVANRGRDPLPKKLHFTTYFLRYSQMKWVTIDALEKHWERADLDADFSDPAKCQITTKNIAAFSINLPDDTLFQGTKGPPKMTIDGTLLEAPPLAKPWSAHFTKASGKWTAVQHAGEGLPETHKRPGLTGPVDDAFMDRFVFVRPTGKPLNEKLGAWTQSEMQGAMDRWRTVFRGEAPIVDDTSVTPDQIANANLVLWGDPSSNAVLRKIAAKLPIQWSAEKLTTNTDTYSSADHAPILVYPNPLNPQRYVVLNSGFTFREGSAISNAQQTPKLPDWSIVDLKVAPTSQMPGRIVEAGFFDEYWQWPKH